jgi:hypothetical protein
MKYKKGNRDENGGAENNISLIVSTMSLYSAYAESLLELHTRRLRGWTRGPVAYEGSMCMQETN